ncbi:hypothetical protein [Carbonactinospora thermoautotrophica]|nr:hypothetical protein [Carbonactinospora thermoautotrophica]
MAWLRAALACAHQAEADIARSWAACRQRIAALETELARLREGGGEP